jgi:hypothetical protein
LNSRGQRAAAFGAAQLSWMSSLLSMPIAIGLLLSAEAYMDFFSNLLSNSCDQT